MKLKVLPIRTWNPTKIFSYEECPLRTQLRYAQHLCPSCFKGEVPFDGECSKCGEKQIKSEAMARGIRLDEALAVFLEKAGAVRSDLLGSFSSTVNKEIAVVSKIPGKNLLLKHSISLSPDWKPLPPFTKGPWFWGELDVLGFFKKLASVTDWKSGGINKKLGEPRPSSKYLEQLEIYGTAVLSAFPSIEEVQAKLVFLDAKKNPVVKAPSIFRKMLQKLQKKWEGRIKPMFSDEVFAPRPGWYCTYCDYSKRRRGPCQF